MSAAILVGDIGGTFARFARAAPDGALAEAHILPIADHATIDAALARYGALTGTALPAHASFAVACPVEGDAIHFTNNAWSFSTAELAARQGFARLQVLNDFEAVAHAVTALDDTQFGFVCGPSGPLPRNGVVTVLGPGTGLGVALALHGGGHWHVRATEAGHVAFAPRDAFEDALVARLRAQYGRVSQERVVSGPGLAAIHALLVDGAVEEEPAALWARALGGADPQAREALTRFLGSYGAVAGDLALAQGADAVVLAGSLSRRLADHLSGPAFTQAFRAKGRFESLMADTPVRLLLHPDPGLFGAGVAFERASARLR